MPNHTAAQMAKMIRIRTAPGVSFESSKESSKFADCPWRSAATSHRGRPTSGPTSKNPELPPDQVRVRPAKHQIVSHRHDQRPIARLAAAHVEPSAATTRKAGKPDSYDVECRV